MSDDREREDLPHEDLDVPPSVRQDVDSSPSSERETEQLQEDQEGSPALKDVDRSEVKLLPGTGDYTDDGDVEVDPGELHIPLHPERDAVGPLEHD